MIEPVQSTTMISSDKRRLEFLDALRGLAAIYVVIYHMLLLPQPNLVPPRWAAKFALAGGTGITLFFIVSAFSLYYTMPLRLKERSPVGSFYLHRFFRIAPLFYVLLVLSLIRDRWLFGQPHAALDVALSAAFVFNLVPLKQEGLVWASWTIGVEMLFYLAFPLIYRRVKSCAEAVTFVFVCLLAWSAIQLLLDYPVIPASWKASILQWSVFRHLPTFAAGILVYHVYMSLDAAKIHAGHFKSVGDAFIMAGLFGFMAYLQFWLPTVFGDDYYWQGVIFGCIFVGLALSPWTLFVNVLTRYLGKISYSIYLVHTTVVFMLTPVYHFVYQRSPSLSVAFLACLTLTLAIVLPISTLTYRLIEEPGMWLGKRVAALMRARPGRATVHAEAG
jgi:peptidoglycan/LPS O-acetylase OafA/YrhL